MDQVKHDIYDLNMDQVEHKLLKWRDILAQHHWQLPLFEL